MRLETPFINIITGSSSPTPGTANNSFRIMSGRQPRPARPPAAPARRGGSSVASRTGFPGPGARPTQPSPEGDEALFPDQPRLGPRAAARASGGEAPVPGGLPALHPAGCALPPRWCRDTHTPKRGPRPKRTRPSGNPARPPAHPGSHPRRGFSSPQWGSPPFSERVPRRVPGSPACAKKMWLKTFP